MRLLTRLLVVGLIGVVTPGLAEATENLWHLVTTGHGAHAIEAGADHAPEGREHGCSGVYHLCTCCHTAPVEVAPALSPTAGERSEDRARRSVTAAPAPPFLPGPYHPPQA